MSSPSVYSRHTHTEGWGELHFVLQGWKVLPGKPSAWGGWGSCSATRDAGEKYSLCLQGLLREETHTCANFAFHLYLSLSCSLLFLHCIHLLPTWLSYWHGKCSQCCSIVLHMRHGGAGLNLPAISAEAVSLLWTFPMVSSPARWLLPMGKRDVLLLKPSLCFAAFLSCLLSFLPSPSPALSPGLTTSQPLILSAAKCHWHKTKVQWPA